MAWVCLTMGSPQGLERVSTAALSPVQTYMTLPRFPLKSFQTLISLTICLHCPWGPFIVCNLSLTVQVSFLPVRKTTIAHNSSNPVAHPNGLFHSFCLGNNEIFFSTEFLNRISESRRSRFFFSNKGSSCCMRWLKIEKKTHVA